MVSVCLFCIFILCFILLCETVCFWIVIPYKRISLCSVSNLRILRENLVKAGSHVDLDFDHQFVPAHKFDAKYSYRQDHGYFPGWASIGGIIVGGENRNGNTNVNNWNICPFPSWLRTWFS